MINTIAPLAARILLGGFFLMAGLFKLGDVQGFAGYMASGGIPGFLAWPAILFEILAGLALIAGYQTRLVSLALAGFCVVSTVLYHNDPNDQIQMTMFLKNIALAGGYVALAGLGAGRLSADAVLGGRTAAA